MEILISSFQKNYKFGRHGLIDETMVKFKGRSSFKQYLPAKPIERGYKIWRLCDSITGYLFNCRIYVGKTDAINNETLGRTCCFESYIWSRFRRKASVLR